MDKWKEAYLEYGEPEFYLIEIIYRQPALVSNCEDKFSIERFPLLNEKQKKKILSILGKKK